MKSELLDLVFASDDAGVNGLAVAAYTAAQASSVDVRLWIIQEGIHRAAQERLRALWMGTGRVAEVHFHPAPQLPQWWATKIHPAICYSRVQLDLILPAAVERCIYLDIDTMTGTDLMDLYRTDLKGNLVGMALNDGLGPDGQAYVRSLGIAPEEYCNSGVMLIDMKGWRAESARAGLLATRKRMPVDLLCADQDLLNVFFQKRITLLDLRWNLRDAAAPAENAVLHFAGRPKPWAMEDFRNAPSGLKQWQQTLEAIGFQPQSPGAWPRLCRRTRSLRARVERALRRRLA